jgi:hypothetical protein
MTLRRPYWIGPRGSIYFSHAEYLAALDAVRQG